MSVAVATPIAFFDSHVHFWDPALSDAYPQLAPDADFATMGLGRAAGMKRRYDPDSYLAEAGAVDITGVVHVTATRGSGQYLGETVRMARLRAESGLPTVLVGGFDPAASVAVIEHTGWPQRADDPEHSEQWRQGLRALAGVSGNVHCKLSGLAMTLGTFDVAALRPWIEFALEVFGVDRCFFGSNFPVDAMFGDLPTLVGAYQAIIAPLGLEAQAALFNGNAQRVYRPVTLRR
jgi:predicted TIM-barrel fold metal-dependent hydrolase